MKNNLTIQEGTYPAIYDFSIFPLALGSALTWNVKTCIRAIEAGKKSLDIYVCADEKGPFNLLQTYFLNEHNYQLHVFELLPAFYCNPMVQNVYIYHNRETFNCALEQAAKGDNVAKAAIEDYERIRRSNTCRANADKILIEFIEGHQSILKFHKERGYIPKNTAPKGCEQQAREFLRRIGEDHFIITTQFRIGSLTAGRTEESHLPEDMKFSFDVWYDFMKVMERKFPDVKFLILGKLPDMPVMCLRLKNVIVPRLRGLNLGHELAFIKLSNLHMGHASGFAGMAWFTDVPFVITSMQKEGYSWVGYESNIERFPFCNNQQQIIFETESVPMLLNHFGKIYQTWKSNSQKAARHGEDKVQTAFLFSTSEELKRELKEYILTKVRSISASPQLNQGEAALSALDNIWNEYSEIVDEVPMFHAVKATALSKIGKFQEAKASINKALELDPSDQGFINLNKAIDSSLQRKVVTT